MKIYVCQIKPLVGDFLGNFKQIKDNYQEAVNQGADICLFPEMATCGYMAGDLFFNSDFNRKNEEIVKDIVSLAADTYLILPTIIKKEGHLYNGVILAHKGKIVGKTFKQDLPNMSIFDEKRYFESAKISELSVFNINGVKVAVPICRDIWNDKICKILADLGADIFLVPNASPYEKGKLDKRINNIKKRYSEVKKPFVYCNQVMSQDGILFDGRSFCYDSEGVKIIGDNFVPSSQILYFLNKKLVPEIKYDYLDDYYAELLLAIKLGIRDYVFNNGFSKVIIGLSGGVDSAIVTFLSVISLGAENVFTYALPSKISSRSSMEDAKLLVKNLGVDFEVIEINDIVNLFQSTIKGALKNESSIAYQNIQSRIRGTILMAKANEKNALLFTTGNKSEYATGYATIYGDMNGSFNPIKDLYKTELYELAHYINREKEIIPKSILEKAPSAELSVNQKDSDNLPEYDILDKILYRYIEKEQSILEIKKDFDSNIVDKVINLLRKSEFKRWQSAPGIRVSSKNFEKDWRMPITCKSFY